MVYFSRPVLRTESFLFLSLSRRLSRRLRKTIDWITLIYFSRQIIQLRRMFYFLALSELFRRQQKINGWKPFDSFRKVLFPLILMSHSENQGTDCRNSKVPVRDYLFVSVANSLKMKIFCVFRCSYVTDRGMGEVVSLKRLCQVYIRPSDQLLSFKRLRSGTFDN